jgi:hypothetical protein
MDPTKKRPDPLGFRVGDKVRVKSGVMCPDWEDIPLGGWAGTIKKVATSADPIIEIEWDKNQHGIRTELAGTKATPESTITCR